MSNILETLPKLFSDAFIKSVKETLQFDEAAILGSTSTIAGKIILTGINSLIPSIIGAVLESFIKANDSELKKLSKQLSKLIREPFLTGIDQLKTSLKTTPTTEAEMSFQQQRLMAALQNFDKAYQLSEEDEKANIKFLQGITSLKVSGGANEAKIRLGEFIQIATTKKEQFEGEIGNLQQTINDKRQQAESIVVTIPKGGGGLVSFSGSSAYFKKMELLNTANIIELQSAKTLDDIHQLERIIATTTITYNLID